jgi:hypothetical protein
MIDHHGDNGLPGQGPARTAPRDSLFLMTVVSAPEGRTVGKARVRNLSATGLMADVDKALREGDNVSLTLRGVGEVTGKVVWTEQKRIGIKFDSDIDPKQARKPVGTGCEDQSVPHYLQELNRKKR